MASFQAKIGWKRPKREKLKISVSFRSYPTRNRKFQTNRKKIQKIIKYYYGIISSQNKGETLRKGENKNYRHVPFQPDT